jgi:hypothetical protein
MMQKLENRIQWDVLARDFGKLTKHNEPLYILDYLAASPLLLKLFESPTGNQSDVGRFMEQNPVLLSHKFSTLIAALIKISGQVCTTTSENKTVIYGLFREQLFYIYYDFNDSNLIEAIYIGGPMSLQHHDVIACSIWINGLKLQIVHELSYFFGK